MSLLVDRHRSVALVLAAVLPLLACALLATVRSSIENTNAALLLVLIVVAAASTGLRFAGVLAAVSSALCFDYFLTAPFHRLAIDDRADLETAVLLVLVGVAVTEIALWGRRQQARSSRSQGYLDGMLQTVGSAGSVVADGPSLSDVVADELRDVLAIDDARFTTSSALVTSARLERDGELSRDSRPVDVDSHGLPTDTEIELAVQNAGVVYGRYLLTASTRICRPSLEQRRVAVALADQVGASLAAAGRHLPAG